MEDTVAEMLSELKDHLAEMTDEERLEVFAELAADYCLRCGGAAGCYCGPEYDE